MRKFREVWASIQKLDHLQTQALLLRYCASFCKVVHLFRTVPPALLSAELTQFDHEFRVAMENITGRTSDFTWAFMGLGCGFVRRDYMRLVVTWQAFALRGG
jgi:hypothetical protein